MRCRYLLPTPADVSDENVCECREARTREFKKMRGLDCASGKNDFLLGVDSVLLSVDNDLDSCCMNGRTRRIEDDTSGLYRHQFPPYEMLGATSLT